MSGCDCRRCATSPPTASTCCWTTSSTRTTRPRRCRGSGWRGGGRCCRMSSLTQPPATRLCWTCSTSRTPSSGSGRMQARPTCRPWTCCTRLVSLHQMIWKSVHGLHASALPPVLEVGERRPGLPAGHGRPAPGRPLCTRYSGSLYTACMHQQCHQFWKWEPAGPAYLQAMDVLHQAGLLHRAFCNICTRPACMSIASSCGSGRMQAPPTCGHGRAAPGRSLPFHAGMHDCLLHSGKAFGGILYAACMHQHCGLLAKQPTRQPSAYKLAAGAQDALSQLSVMLGSLCATGSGTAMLTCSSVSCNRIPRVVGRRPPDGLMKYCAKTLIAASCVLLQCRLACPVRV